MKANGEQVKPDLSNDDVSRFVDRLQALEEERLEVVGAIGELLEEAKSAGLHRRALKAVVKRRLETPEQAAIRVELEETLDSYLARLGMLAGTPLGDAATASAGLG